MYKQFNPVFCLIAFICFLFLTEMDIIPPLSFPAGLWFSSEPVVWNVAGDEGSIWRDPAEKVESVLQVLSAFSFSLNVLCFLHLYLSFE